MLLEVKKKWEILVFGRFLVPEYQRRCRDGQWPAHTQCTLNTNIHEGLHWHPQVNQPAHSTVFTIKTSFCWKCLRLNTTGEGWEYLRNYIYYHSIEWIFLDKSVVLLRDSVCRVFYLGWVIIKFVLQFWVSRPASADTRLLFVVTR